MKKNGFFSRCLALAMTALLILSSTTAVYTENYSANVMRLLNYEGEVYILDAEGNSRFLMENVRFNSGESLSTNAGAMASVGLDAAKILTLDSMTQVMFAKENNHMTLTLASGRLLLDVQKKLDENETFDIQTSNMTVGIRGTVVYLTSFDGSEEEINKTLLESNASFRELLNRTLPSGYSGNFSQLVVLEGTAVATFENENGHVQSVEVHAGEKITVVDDQREDAVVSQATSNDLGSDMVEFIQNDPVLSEKVEEASDILNTDSNKQEAETGISEENQPERKEPIVPDDIPPEHVHEFSPDFIPPTCTADGEIIYKCDCGELFRVSAGSALGHDWGPWSVVTAATTEQDGQEMSQCTRCGDIQTRSIPKLDPTPTPVPTETPTPVPPRTPEPSPTPHVHASGEPVYENEIAASCEKAGSIEVVIYCETCGEEISRTTETIPAPGHDWGEWEIVSEPACTKGGLQQRTCQRCGATASESLPATGHTPITEPGTAATCTESGWTEHIYCAVCEEVLEPYQEEISALGHNWGEFVTVEDPNCGVDGLKQRTCQRESCDAEEEQVVPATGDHTPSAEATIENEVPETCTTGYQCDYVIYCTVCGQELSREPYSTDAPGHMPGAPTDVPVTCVASGWSGRVFCTVCDALLTEGTEIPSTGTEHSYSHETFEKKPVPVPEMGEDYYEMKLCEVFKCKWCGDEYWVPVEDDDPPIGYPDYT